MAIPDAAARWTRHVMGEPGSFEALRARFGTALRVPTLAERLSGRGEFVAFSNVSRGGALALDPEGHGRLHHRSFGPGGSGRAGEVALKVTHDAAGDRAMTERFCAELLQAGGGAAVSLLWLSEPDLTQHGVPLGSIAARDAIAAADGCFARVGAVCGQLQIRGEDILLLAGSDHGHQTTGESIDLEQILIDAGMKAGPASDDVIVAANGTAALIYLAASASRRRDAIAAFIRGQDWSGAVIDGEALATVGHADGAAGGPQIAVSMGEAPGAANQYGVPGISSAIVGGGAEVYHPGSGNHGGLGRYEQAPFLMIRGAGFGAGAVRREPTSLVDIAPTVLRHLDMPAEGMDGRPLQRS
jgi:hypothetical protein